MKILVVDDFEENRFSLKVLLRHHGYTVDTAENGSVALTKARRSPPDLIISDLLMPVMDGYSLCREWMMDERLKLIPLVFYTASFTEDRDRRFALELGAAQFIVKPEDPEELLRIVGTLLAERQAGLTPAAPGTRPDGQLYLKAYSETLVRKLEVKMRELEQANRELERDIAERKRAEAALRREQELFNQLTGAIPDYIYFKDRQSRFVRINAGMARGLGLAHPEAAVGQTDADIFTAEHAQQAFADEQRIMASGEPIINLEEKETWPDGHVTWVSTTKVPVRDADGAITGLVGISRDITERKAAERLLREQNEILSLSREGVMIVSLANQVTLWNRGAEEMFGWSAAEALGRPPEHLLGFDELGVLTTLRAAVERDGFWRGEVRARARDGRSLIVDARVTLVKDDEGRPRARLSFFADITEQKLLEEKFLHAQRLESIGMLAAGIAHDLNNVLAPIVFAAPLLREGLSTPRDLKILGILEQSADRGAGLVKQILGFAHTATGELQPTQVKHLARDVAGIVEQTFPKSIQLSTHIPSDLSPVQGNATQIHQVLMNLCVNARDAMPQGGTLRLAASNCRLDAAGASAIPGARPGDWVVLEVEDTGSGIAPEVVERMWTPFFTTKDLGKGTGLGLSTVRGIVATHRGFIELRTAVGEGSRFRAFLPALESDAPRQAETSALAVPRGHGELILVVDDDPAICEVVAAILGRHGYRVARCGDGVEAIELFGGRGGEFSLVVTDLDMPRLGGVALATALSQIRPDLRVLAISGLARSVGDDSDPATGQKVVHAFLLKPFKPEDLLVAVGGLLHTTDRS